MLSNATVNASNFLDTASSSSGSLRVEGFDNRVEYLLSSPFDLVIEIQSPFRAPNCRSGIRRLQASGYPSSE